MLTAWAGQKGGGGVRFLGLGSQAWTLREERGHGGRRKKASWGRWAVRAMAMGVGCWEYEQPRLNGASDVSGILTRK